MKRAKYYLSVICLLLIMVNCAVDGGNGKSQEEEEDNSKIIINLSSYEVKILDDGVEKTISAESSYKGAVDYVKAPVGESCFRVYRSITVSKDGLIASEESNATRGWGDYFPSFVNNYFYGDTYIWSNEFGVKALPANTYSKYYFINPNNGSPYDIDHVKEPVSGNIYKIGGYVFSNKEAIITSNGILWNKSEMANNGNPVSGWGSKY